MNWGGNEEEGPSLNDPELKNEGEGEALDSSRPRQDSRGSYQHQRTSFRSDSAVMEEGGAAGLTSSTHHQIIAWVFMAQLGATCLYGIWTWVAGSRQIQYSIPGWLFLSAGIAALIAGLSLHLMKSNAQSVLLGGQGMSVIMVATMSIYSFSNGHWAMGIILALSGAGVVCWLRACTPQIPFTSLLLAKSIEIVQAHAQVLTYAYATVGVLIVYFFMWSECVSTFYRTTGNSNFSIIIMLSLCYWTVHVALNVIVTATCGIVTLHFEGEPQSGASQSDVVLQSFQTSLTQNLGSIAYGSLITPLLTSAQILIKMLRATRWERVNEYAAAGLAFIEDCMRSFNNYAFVHIAIHSSSYPAAAHSTWTLLRRNGLHVIVQETLVEGLAFWMSTTIGMAVGFGVGIWAGHLSVVFLGSFVAVGTVRTMLCIVGAVVRTIFVYFAECPAGLEQVDIELHRKIKEVLDSDP